MKKNETFWKRLFLLVFFMISRFVSRLGDSQLRFFGSKNIHGDDHRCKGPKRDGEFVGIEKIVKNAMDIVG